MFDDLFNKLKSGGLADKKLLIKFGIGFGAVLIFLIILNERYFMSYCGIK